jgi:hypothetical protein
MTDSLAVVKRHADEIEARVAFLEKVVDEHELAVYLSHGRLDKIGRRLFDLLGEHHPNWTEQEREKAHRDLASVLEGTMRLPSRFAGAKGPDGAQD